MLWRNLFNDKKNYFYTANIGTFYLNGYSAGSAHHQVVDLTNQIMIKQLKLIKSSKKI
jgi:hypothetical protein